MAEQRRIALLVAVVLAAGSGLLLLAHEDRPAARWIASHRSGSLVDACAAATQAGDYVWATILALLVTAAVASQVGRSAALRIPLAVIAAAVTTSLLKELFDRARPAASVAARHVGGASFPSGHASSSVALATALILVVGMRGLHGLAWLAIPFAVVIASTRPCLGVHYVSDVLAGAAWGIACALVATWRVTEHRGEQEA